MHQEPAALLGYSACSNQFQVAAGKLDAANPEALRVLYGFTSPYHNMSAAAVQEQLQGLFDHVVLLPVTREHSAYACEQPGTAEKLRHLCAQGFVHTRYASTAIILPACEDACSRTAILWSTLNYCLGT